MTFEEFYERYLTGKLEINEDEVIGQLERNPESFSDTSLTVYSGYYLKKQLNSKLTNKEKNILNKVMKERLRRSDEQFKDIL